MQSTVEPVHRDWLIRTVSRDKPQQAFTYPYFLRSGPGAERELVEKLSALSPAPDRFAIVIDGAFPLALAETVQDQIATIGPCTLHVFHGGETAKNLVTVALLGNEVLDAGVTRRSVIVALGGGLAGNVAGLLAALVMRGIRLIQIPTTLLSMSDSCLSLKQGVNSLVGKNHFGQFYPPAFVWANLMFLNQLPAREIRAALCELVKNTLAICPERFAEVRDRLRADAVYSHAELAWFIDLCITAKGTVMADDALEKHQSVVLEYGHTIGHVLELHTHGEIPHGLAIGIGMVVEARIAVMLGLLSSQDFEAHLTLLRANGAPTAIPAAVMKDDLMPLLGRDNKRGYVDPRSDAVDMVLLRALGKPNTANGTVITQVPIPLVQQAIEWSRTQPDPYLLDLRAKALSPVHAH